MSVGVTLTQKDLEAIRELYFKRWTAEISNWKEPNTDYCLWFVHCPNKTGALITETGNSLAETIDKLLQRALE